MMKLNNKGFFSISIIYSFLLLFILLMLGIVSSYVVRDSLIGSVIRNAKINIEKGTYNSTNTLAGILLNYDVTLESEIEDELTLPTKENEAYFVKSSEVDDYGSNTYYFRGDVKDNYLSYGGLLWRIVRINGDMTLDSTSTITRYGTVRLVANECIKKDDSILTTVWKEEENVTDFTTALNALKYEGSSVEEHNTTWFNTLTQNNQNFISQSNYCNDLSYEVVSENNIFNSYTRVVTNNDVTFKCNEAQNIYTKSKVGILTVDEVIYAGGFYNAEEEYTSSYLSNNLVDSNWWTMSPHSYKDESSISLFAVTPSGKVIENSSKTQSCIRPVISISSDVFVTGVGTSSDPYVIRDIE